ncbi:tRNA pseudouridine synthase Pus10 [Frankliniella fusca]|uniref:tRNA pseudouridine(55) synthase n=1 Tax=Frankliniella fusca TaxID=407009 RepID=A0AAE1GRX7_9NEOP|nr:tRNA pseudouridine synthase Pus10 [Frankliniella fusca]
MDAPSESKSLKEIYQQLREIGCCKLCCLRYLGERSQHAFQNPDAALQMKFLTDGAEIPENPSKLKKSNVCTACMGLLQETVRDTFIEKIVTDVNAADYDCKEFSCALSMPVSFSLRTHSLNLYIDEVFPDDKDEPAELRFMSVKEVWKWIAAPLLAKGICKTFNPKDCDFSITISIGYEEDEKECNCLMDMHKEIYEMRKQQTRKFKDCVLSRKSVESLLISTDPSHFRKFYPTPPNIPNTPFVCSSVIPLHNSLFIAGRYNKYSRKLSQTPWLIDGKRLMETSVQELLCNPIVELAKAEDLRFASSGREDVDVRMLGKGRPFFCELINPHRVHLLPSEFRKIENTILSTTKDIAARHLQIVSKDQVSQIKTGEEEKIKLYCAYCIVSGEKACVDWEKLESLPSKCPIVLQQKTPIRVLHRRSLATRERTIFRLEVCKAETNEPKAFVLKMATQAGTYIKEFVHGDFGRTTPSLRDLLGTDVDILALDVMDIELDWPPEVNYNEETGVKVL